MKYHVLTEYASVNFVSYKDIVLSVGDPSVLSERFPFRGRSFFEPGYHLEQMGVTFFEEKHFNNFLRKKSANYKGCNILEEK